MKHIRNIAFTLSILTAFTVTITACAQSKKAGKSNKAATTTQTKKTRNTKPVLLAALKQPQHLANRTERPAELKFILVWKDSKEPAAFFWQDVKGWQACDIARVKNYNHKTYAYEPVTDNKLVIKAGDTLELHPITGGKHPMPETIPQDAEHILYYKTADGIWKGITVTSFEELAPAPPPDMMTR